VLEPGILTRVEASDSREGEDEARREDSWPFANGFFGGSKRSTKRCDEHQEDPNIEENPAWRQTTLDSALNANSLPPPDVDDHEAEQCEESRAEASVPRWKGMRPAPADSGGAKREEQ
jgi:hypothetical protein